MAKPEKIAERAVAVIAAHGSAINLTGDPGGVPLIFEETSQGRSGIDLLDGDESESRAREILGEEYCRADIEDFPELSEPQVVRHFLRLSQLNFGQALQFYPLGSCTMKYNPAVNDELAALGGFAALHPLTPPHLAQGALELMVRLERAMLNRESQQPEVLPGRKGFYEMAAGYFSRLFFCALRAVAAAAEAFFARTTRSSGVMVSRERLPPIFPPIFPPFAPCLRKYSRTSGGSFFFAMNRS